LLNAHAAPPLATLVVIEKVRVRTAVPQVPVHALYALNAPTQSTAAVFVM
jgi:hypothetical protein